jgi:lysophospholipase L1-like esterase
MRMPSSQKTVLCFGDSNTHGTRPMRDWDDRRRYAPDERWPGHLAAALGAGWRVVEEGLPGRTTAHPDPLEGAHKNGLAALPIMLETHVPIDVVVLMLGTNDLKMRFSVPASDTALALDHLILEMQASDAGPDKQAPKIALIAPPPIIETGFLATMFAGGAEKSEALGALCAEVAARHGVGFLDAGTVVQSSSVDGIHFEAEAHAKLGRAIAEVVSSL